MLSPGQVGPILNGLGITLTDGYHDDGIADHSVMQLGLPVVRDEPCLRDLVYVAFEREGGDVRFKSADDGARLCAAPLVRLLEQDLLAGLLFPVLLKSRNDRFTVSLARRGVGSKD